jgi:hypothetical protein
MVRNITISPTLNGWLVQVGCQSVVFVNIDTMCAEIKKYYANPDETEKGYINNAINKMTPMTLLDMPWEVGQGQATQTPR